MKNYSAQENLYLLSITPPTDLAFTIDQERRFSAARFGSYESLKSPVALNLFGVFTVPAMAYELTDYLSEWISVQPQFKVQIKDFGVFENKHRPEVYVNVKNNIWLNAFNKGLSRKMLQRFPYLNSSAPFKPHIRLAHKDLSRENFQRAKKYYSQCKFEASFDVKNIALFRHNYKMWEFKHEFALSPQKVEGSGFVQKKLFA